MMKIHYFVVSSVCAVQMDRVTSESIDDVTYHSTDTSPDELRPSLAYASVHDRFQPNHWSTEAVQDSDDVDEIPAAHASMQQDDDTVELLTAVLEKVLYSHFDSFNGDFKYVFVRSQRDLKVSPTWFYNSLTSKKNTNRNWKINLMS